MPVGYKNKRIHGQVMELGLIFREVLVVGFKVFLFRFSRIFVFYLIKCCKIGILEVGFLWRVCVGICLKHENYGSKVYFFRKSTKLGRC